MLPLRIYVPDETEPSCQNRPERKTHTLPKSLTVTQEVQLVQFARDQLARLRVGTKRRGPNATKIRAAERDLFAVLLDLGTGLRVAEICDLLVGDIDLVERFVHVRHGKGDKERYVPIRDALLPTVQAWIGTRRDGFVISPDRGGRFCEVTMYWRIRRLGARAGLPKSIHPHNLRHTFGQRIYDSTHDMEVVRALLGHESISTAQIYAAASLTVMREAVNMLGLAKPD